MIKRKYIRTVVLTKYEVIKLLNLPKDGEMYIITNYNDNVHAWAKTYYNTQAWEKDMPKKMVEKKLRLLEGEKLIYISYEAFNREVFVIETTKEIKDKLKKEYTKEFNDKIWYRRIFAIKKDVNRLYLNQI